MARSCTRGCPVAEARPADSEEMRFALRLSVDLEPIQCHMRIPCGRRQPAPELAADPSAARSSNGDPPIPAGAIGPTQWTHADCHGHGSSGIALDCASPAALATFCSELPDAIRRSGVTLGTDRPRQRRRMRNM
jgi:hypothetical protein